MYRLPNRYLTLLTALRDHREGRRAWLGDVGFRLGTGAHDDAEWHAILTSSRWRGMHPDLVPFAEDGFGNQFCFVHGSSEAMEGVQGVVYWMYETYRAVPIASSFDAFLKWVALTAGVSARRGDEVVDEQHVSGELLPMLTEIGLGVTAAELAVGPDVGQSSVHTAFLRMDRRAPGSLLSLARRQFDEGRGIEAIETCRLALAAFPDFAAARVLEARILLTDGDPQACRALQSALRLPLVYGGDTTMPFMAEVQESDPAWVAESLAKHPMMQRISDDDPIWILATRDDPMVATSWVEVALDYARAGDFEDAVAMACNAQWLGLGTSLEPEIHGLLHELYTALDRPWHAGAVARWGPGVP